MTKDLERVKMAIHPAIVIIAYNRAEPLKRLLKSIERASYPDEGVTLIISIDAGGAKEVKTVADDFDWKHGEKKVIHRPEPLGLKKHVLLCSSYAMEYGSAIILEDDLYVARDFYYFAMAAIEHSEKGEDAGRIAGVSLYNHLLNVHVREPFEAVDDGADNWYFQFASSWGQAYTASQWSAFKEWFDKNDNTPFPDSVPAFVRSWSDEKSWLKYFIRYVVQEDKYFLYPRVSRTTNFGDEGTHAVGQCCDLQVPLYRGTVGDSYDFSSLSDSVSVYDAFFENAYLPSLFDRDIRIDLYGAKGAPESGLYLTCRYDGKGKLLKTYGRSLRPIDANISEDISGNDFFLIDLDVTGGGSSPVIPDETDKYLYNYRAFKAKYGVSIIKRRLFK